MNIIFISRYGSTNLGDELIVREMEKLISDNGRNTIQRFNNNFRYFPNLEVAFKHSTLYPDSHLNKNLIKTIYYSRIRKSFLIAKARNFFNKRKADKNPNISTFLAELEKSDALIIGGGNLVFDLEDHSESAYYLNIPISKAKKIDIPVAIMDVGIGPFQTDLQLMRTREVLEQTDFISVRDKKSYNLISSLKKPKIYQSIDPITLWNNEDVISKNIESKAIAISVMNVKLGEHTDSIYNNYLNNLLKIALYLNQTYQKKIYFFCTEVTDLVALEDLKKIVNNRNLVLHDINFVEEVSLESISNIYNSIQGVIGTRMHSLILAYSHNVPFIGISWQEKVTSFSEMVNNNRYIIDLEKIESNNNLNIIDSWVSDLDNIKNRFIQSKDKMRELYGVNKQILNFLDEMNEKS